ncbi:MAG: TatD family hydrolase [Deltaproteobacteria bacterium]|nr:TatD family hydrolase [Deltaproteobacteria bacterium]
MTNRVVLIDTHAHLEVIDSISEVLDRASESGVETVIAVSSDLDSSRRSIEISNSFHAVYSAVGIHPHEASGFNDIVLAQLVSLVGEKRVKAIGETGLDYHYLHSTRESQIMSFKNHIGLAIEFDLPLIIHIREAFDDVLNILSELDSSNARGVIHCFTGDYEKAKGFIDLGFFVSFSGIVTFKNADDARDAARRIPLDRMLIETDSPYLAPVPYRGKRNEPAYVVHVAEKIAELRGTSYERIAGITTSNAKELFKLDG